MAGNKTLGLYAEAEITSPWHTHLLSKGKITFQSYVTKTTMQASAIVARFGVRLVFIVVLSNIDWFFKLNLS